MIVYVMTCNDVALYWIAHAIPAVGGYTTCTFLVPMARFSETGIACATMAPVPGAAIQAVFLVEEGASPLAVDTALNSGKGRAAAVKCLHVDLHLGIV